MQQGEFAALKQQLPHPYNQDMSQVLRHLNRRTPLGRDQLANHPMTAAWLAAAMRLIEQHLDEPAGPAPSDQGPAVPPGEHRPLLGFLSQRAVAAELAKGPEPFPRAHEVSALRTTWRRQSDFVADVVGFVLWTGYYPARYDQVLAGGSEQLVEGSDLAAVVQDLAFRISQLLVHAVSFRLQLVAIASAGGDEVVRQAVGAKYRRGHELWEPAYREMLLARGLRLRPGLTLPQLTDILTALTEGLILRHLGDAETVVLDEKRQESLLGVAALALLNGCLEPVEGQDGRSLAEALNARVHRRG